MQMTASGSGEKGTMAQESASIWHGEGDYDILGESPRLRKHGKPWLCQRLAALPEIDRPVVVDFGCWSGRHLRMLEQVASSCATEKSHARETVIGIDEPFADARVAEARKANPGVQVYDTGIKNTGLGASSVDAGICWRVLHNLVKPNELVAAITEIHRVLREGAPLVVAVRAALPGMVTRSAWPADTRLAVNKNTPPEPQTDAAEPPVPVLQRTYSQVGERSDLYFTHRACHEFFSSYGFDVWGVERFAEEELVDIARLSNEYWMVFMTCNKDRSVGQVRAGQWLSHPGDGSYI